MGDGTGNPCVVDESLIGLLQSRMMDGFVSMDHPKIVKGDKLITMDGPFSGMTGLFLNKFKPNERIMILLNAIQSQAKVEVPMDLVVRA